MKWTEPSTTSKGRPSRNAAISAVRSASQSISTPTSTGRPASSRAATIASQYASASSVDSSRQNGSSSHACASAKRYTCSVIAISPTARARARAT